MKNKAIFFWITSLLIFSLVLSACGGDDEPTVEGGSSGNVSSDNQATSNDNADTPADDTDTQTADIPSPLDDMVTEQWVFGQNIPFTIPEADIEGGFVFAVNRVLLYGEFNGQPVTVVSQGTTPAMIFALPGGRIFYRGNGVESRNAALVQIPTETTFLADYSLNSDGLLLNWNADGTWVTYVDRAIMIAAADGSYSGTIPLDDPTTNVDEVIWLDDDTLLYKVDDEDGAILSLNRYDPIDHTSTLVEVDFDPESDDLISLEDDLRELGYRYASPNVLDVTKITPDGKIRYTIDQPENRSATGICDEWRVERSELDEGLRETFYAIDNTHALTNINVLPDMSVLVLRWFRADCAFSNPIEAELIRVYPDGEGEVVTDKVLVNTNQVQPFTLERRYTVSPDGRYVMWIGQDVGVEGDTTLEIFDLEAGVQKRVAQMPARATGGFDVFFSSVTWLE